MASRTRKSHPLCAGESYLADEPLSVAGVDGGLWRFVRTAEFAVNREKDGIVGAYRRRGDDVHVTLLATQIDEEAERFYQKYDFIKLPDSGKMFIAMATLNQLFTG